MNGFKRRLTFSICIAVALGLPIAMLSPSPAAAYGTTMNVSIASSMTLSRSTVEVEFPVTVTCDPIGAYDSYVYVRLAQAHTNATGSESVRPLICDSTPHTYTEHLFADDTPFQDGPTAAAAFAENIAQNSVQQSGSAAGTTKLVLGPVAVSASQVTGSETGSTYSVSMSDRASLEYPATNGEKGYGEAIIPVTVMCTPSTTTTSPWIGVALEEADGSRVIVGTDRGSTVQEPTLICDGVARTYSWIVFGSTSTAPYDGILPGELSVCAWVEGDPYPLQGSTGAENADAVNTVHATNG